MMHTLTRPLLLLTATTLIAATPTVVAKKDSLGGVTIGQSFSLVGWERDINGSPYRTTTIAGYRGALFVDVCGDVVHRAQFQVLLTNDPRDTSGAPIDRVQDPRRTALQVVEDFQRALEATGWSLASTSVPTRSDTHNTVSMIFMKGQDEKNICLPPPPPAYYAWKLELSRCRMARAPALAHIVDRIETYTDEYCSNLERYVTSADDAQARAAAACPYETIEVVDSPRNLEVSCTQVMQPLLTEVTDCSVVLYAGSSEPCTVGL